MQILLSSCSECSRSDVTSTSLVWVNLLLKRKAGSERRNSEILHLVLWSPEHETQCVLYILAAFQGLYTGRSTTRVAAIFPEQSQVTRCCRRLPCRYQLHAIYQSLYTALNCRWNCACMYAVATTGKRVLRISTMCENEAPWLARNWHENFSENKAASLIDADKWQSPPNDGSTFRKFPLLNTDAVIGSVVLASVMVHYAIMLMHVRVWPPPEVRLIGDRRNLYRVRC